jgi:uncharacterized protein
MITIISPAKTMNFKHNSPVVGGSPYFDSEVNVLIKICDKLSISAIKKLMGVSDKLAELNYDRFQNFETSNDKKEALYYYNGDVYDGFEREKYSKSDLEFAQNHLRIISGLYGILKPLDKIKPYRLEMGIKLTNSHGKDLYKFWMEKISKKLEEELKGDYIINLASNEYSNAINKSQFEGKIIDIIFKENRNGELKIIPINSKKARGIMANFIILNKINSPGELKEFNQAGYIFNSNLSTLNNFVFIKN